MERLLLLLLHDGKSFQKKFGGGIFRKNTDCQNIWSRVIKIEMILHFEEHLGTTFCGRVFIPHITKSIYIDKKDLDSLS